MLGNGKSSLRLSRQAHEYIFKYGKNRRDLYPPQVKFQSHAEVKTLWFTERHDLIAHGRAKPALGPTRIQDAFL